MVKAVPFTGNDRGKENVKVFANKYDMHFCLCQADRPTVIHWFENKLQMCSLDYDLVCSVC